MPGPGPHELWIDDNDPARAVVSFQHYFWTGNRGNRHARANAIVRRLRWDDWPCRWCGETLPDFKPADALYCCEGCRKSAARRRRVTGRGGP